MGKKLYVGNLSYDVTGEELEELFRQAGTPVSATVLSDRDSGRSRGFGFVEMSSDDEAQSAIQMFDGQEHKGRRLKVNEAREQAPGGRGGGGRRGGGGPGRGPGGRGRR